MEAQALELIATVHTNFKECVFFRMWRWIKKKKRQSQSKNCNNVQLKCVNEGINFRFLSNDKTRNAIHTLLLIA